MWFLFNLIHLPPLADYRAARSACITALIIAGGGASSFSLCAQTLPLPDAGTILRETERSLPPLAPRPAPQALPERPAIKPAEGVRFVVRSFRLTGVTLIPEADVQKVLSKWLNREIAFSDLEQALQAVADLYQSRGWFARPQLPEQDLGDDGSVRINVLEGRLGAIRIDSGSRPPLSEARVIGMLSQGQGHNEPLHLDKLDRAVSLVNDLPGVRITAALAPGQSDAQSDIVVKGESKGWGGGTASLDNTGSRSTGYDRLSASLNFDNPARLGDQASLNLMRSQGVRFGRLAYSLPLGYGGWRVGLNTSEMNYELVGSFARTQAQGDSTTYGATATYPFQRTAVSNVNLALSVDRKFLFNAAGGRPISDKLLDSLSVGVGGDRSDRLGEGGITLWNVNVAAGYVDLSSNADNAAADLRGPASQGSYQKMVLSLSRLQRLGERDSLWVSLNTQRAMKNLDSAEKFSLGGSQAVRAYPTAEASGDSGTLLTIEHRHSVSAEFQVSPFYDHGWVRLNHNPAFPTAPALNRYSLRGWGVGFSYTQPGRYALRLTFAQRVGGNPSPNKENGGDSDGTLREKRAWLSSIAYF
jgi:hemolysin activation/secretion protein